MLHTLRNRGERGKRENGTKGRGKKRQSWIDPSAWDSALSLLARKEHIRRTIRGQRSVKRGLHLEPEDDEFEIPDTIVTIKTDKEDECFLKREGRHNGRRILISTTNKQLESRTMTTDPRRSTSELPGLKLPPVTSFSSVYSSL